MIEIVDQIGQHQRAHDAVGAEVLEPAGLVEVEHVAGRDLDGVGGLLAFGVGALLGWGMHRWNQNRLDRKYGLESTDALQAVNCVNAIYRIAKHVYDKQQCGGGASAAVLAADGQHSVALVHFLQVLLDKLLFKDVGAEVVDSAADLALALILCYEQLFGTMVQKLVESRPTEEQVSIMLVSLGR